MPPTGREREMRNGMLPGFQISNIIGHLLFLAAICTSTGSSFTADDARLWSAIKNGEAFVILRHALVPGHW